jgi:hypothetical protein
VLELHLLQPLHQLLLLNRSDRAIETSGPNKRYKMVKYKKKHRKCKLKELFSTIRDTVDPHNSPPLASLQHLQFIWTTSIPFIHSKRLISRTERVNAVGK